MVKIRQTIVSVRANAPKVATPNKEPAVVSNRRDSPAHLFDRASDIRNHKTIDEFVGQTVQGRIPEGNGTKYQIGRKIGEGGVGLVYEATSPDGSLVAIKVISDGLNDDPHMLARFGREARIMTKIKHPNS